MTKTVQLLAIAGTEAEETKARMARLLQAAGQDGLFTGHQRRYERRDDDGVEFPPEDKKVRATALEVLALARTALTRHWDLARTLDQANAAAKADVRVDGLVLENVPVGHLLWLNKEVAGLVKLVEALPVLNPAKDWTTSGQVPGISKVEAPVGESKRQKIPGKFVLYDATKEHPAIVERLDTDEVIGTWWQTDFSGAIPQARKDELLARLTRLSEALRMAREEANTATVTDYEEAGLIFDWWLR